jgi:hypothetical protein
MKDIADFIYLMGHFEKNELDNEYFLTKLSEFDSMSKKDKIEFLQILAGHIDTPLVNCLSIHARINLFKKILYNHKLLNDSSAIIIFERLVNFKEKDNKLQLEISNMISSDDEDKIISMLSIDTFSRTYNKSGPAFEKLILFSIFGSKVYEYIENQIVSIIDDEIKIILKPRSIGNANMVRETWKNLALKFVLYSPYANIRNIMLSLYRLDKEFVRTKFITRVPECEKYKVLL